MKLLSLLFSFFPVCAWSHSQGHLGFDLGIDHLSGYSQIPRGGNVGTSSFKRPSFAEVNHKTDKFYDVDIGAEYQHYLIDLQYCHLNPHGVTTLQQPLLTHAQLIPAQNGFRMNTDFDLVTLNVGKSFTFQNRQWEISPKLGGQWLKYQYAFNAGAKASSRSFSAFAPSMSLKIAHPLTKNLSTALEGTVSFGITNLNLYSAVGSLHYKLWQSAHFLICPQLKLGFLEIDFKDKQPFPNHIRYTANPFASAGFVAHLR